MSHRLRSLGLVVAVMLLIGSPPAMAANIHCVWSVHNVRVSVPTGELYAHVSDSTGNGVIGFCNLKTPIATTSGETITAEDCIIVYNQLLAAKLSGEEIVATFKDDVPLEAGLGLSCANIASWNINTAKSLRALILD